MKDITVEQYCDCWEVEVGGKRFRHYHNDEDLVFPECIKQLLEHLGHKVTVEECY
jgi:hypothetical protein